jgi:hypothetical protein
MVVAMPSAQAPPLAEKAAPRASQGIVRTPLSHGHRLFVDGVVIGETPKPVLVTCGPHTVKIGSAGKEQHIDVPCGAAVSVHP